MTTTVTSGANRIGREIPIRRQLMLEEVMRRMPEYRIDHSGAALLRTEFVRGHLHLPFEF